MCRALHHPILRRMRSTVPCQNPAASRKKRVSQCNRISCAARNRGKGLACPAAPNFQPAVMAILHGGVQVKVVRLAQVSFDGIRIEGLLQGNPVTLFAHQSTVQMMCFAKEIREAEERNPIGFIWPDREEDI